MVTAREVANLFLQNDEAPPEELDIRSVTVRMDASRLAYIDSMAEHASVSRNVMANHLLSLGIGQVMGELPDVIREDVERGVMDRTHGGDGEDD
jgi:hypothetical protein